MRDYLKKIEMVGCVMIYRENDICRWSLDWLYEHCDKVLIVLDNWNYETEQIALEYKNKYPDITYISYTDVSIIEKNNTIPGRVKNRFKRKQDEIREFVFKELRKIHKKKNIDLLVWLDSDEKPINEFPKHLEKFWNSDKKFMFCGFVEPFESLQILMSQVMAPHTRVLKYIPELTVYPWLNRCRYHPYAMTTRPIKQRNVIVHVCHLTEEYRQHRQFMDGRDFMTECDRQLWFLPKSVFEMTAEEIADYQPCSYGRLSKYPSVPIQKYLDNKDYYINKFKLKLWNQH